MGRAPCCDKASVKKGPWSPEEDAKLKTYIEQHGTGGNWIALPQKIGIKRCGKSCRLRWLNYLRPNIKHGGFSAEEDSLICSLYISIGSRWSIIAAQLPGRTDNDIKNYWNTKLKKTLLGKRKQSHINRPSSASPDRAQDSSSPSPLALSNSALERLQLHMQLQNLENPFSFYNNPALWPKLHPFQEKMLFQSLGESSSSPQMQHVLPSSGQRGGQEIDIYEQISGNSLGLQQDYPKFDTPSADGSENSLNVLASSDGLIPGSIDNTVRDSSVISRTDAVEESGVAIQPLSTFQAELEALLNNKTSTFMAQENQIADFDCFKEMNGSKDKLMWWSNEFETKSTSSNSWNSEEIFQDYELGCNL